MNKTETTSSGIGFTSLLTILFIGLKLGKVITWSWWWVLSPLWLPWVTVIGIGGIVFIVYLILIGIFLDK